MATDLVIEVDNEPGALARVASAVSDGGVNLSAATCTSPGERAQLHILVKHPEAAKHALATAGVTITTSRSLVIVTRSEEHTSELQSQSNLVCRLLLEKKKTKPPSIHPRPQRPPLA